MILEQIEKSTFVQDFNGFFLIEDRTDSDQIFGSEIEQIFNKENPLEILDKSRFFDLL